MVTILKEVLGQHLFVPDPVQLTRDEKWLSPEELKHKVVLRMKVKPGTYLYTCKALHTPAMRLARIHPYSL